MGRAQRPLGCDVSCNVGTHVHFLSAMNISRKPKTKGLVLALLLCFQPQFDGIPFWLSGKLPLPEGMEPNLFLRLAMDILALLAKASDGCGLRLIRRIGHSGVC